MASREARTARADRLCAAAYDERGGPDSGVALVAVGGYGRGELAPCSDLDLVLVHDDGLDPGDLAVEIWYPLWDAGLRLDHAVRSLTEMAEQAEADPRVILGLLDARHLAGDPGLALRLRSTVLAQWRRRARERLPALRDLTHARHRAAGELAHEAVPDLKEAEGGLRDTIVLRALAATWLVDVPPDLERARRELLDVRDSLQAVTGRRSDRVPPEVWDDLATALAAQRPGEPGWESGATAQRRVRGLGRRVAHFSRLAWRRAEAVMARPARTAGPRRPRLEPIASGLAVADGEVVLDGRVRPDRDPGLLLRAAAQAATRDLVLAPATAARLARESAPVPEPWPTSVREDLVRLLAGPGLLGVWETLDETGCLDLVLPEWERIRLLPHASTIHLWTVDRHVIETCRAAGTLIRRVPRPDLLLLAALLHDIGKGELVEHSIAGAPIARDVVLRIGLPEVDAELVAGLVRHHLLLARVASSRDPDDPATTAYVAQRIDSVQALDLLAALTEADARATAPQAWTTWRAGLVARLVDRTRDVLTAGAPGVQPHRPDEPMVEVPPAVLADPRDIGFTVQDGRDDSGVEAGGGSRVTAVSGDRIGLLADVSGVLAAARVPVRGARVWHQEGPGAGWGVSVWDVSETGLDPAVLRQRFDAIRSGRLDPAARLRRTVDGLSPTVAVHTTASTRATVLEVRAADRQGTVHLVCAALAGIGVEVRSAHVDTLGPQAVDVFYLREEGAGALAEERAAAAAHAVRAALEEHHAGPGPAPASGQP